MTKDKMGQNMFNKLWKGLLFGFIAGYLLSFLLGQSVWLEMRVNIGWALPLMTIIGVAFFAWRKMELKYGWFLLLQIVTLVVFFSFYGFFWGPLVVVPACLLREGFFVDSADIMVVNIIQLSILLAGNIWWLVRDFTKRG